MRNRMRSAFFKSGPETAELHFEKAKWLEHFASPKRCAPEEFDTEAEFPKLVLPGWVSGWEEHAREVAKRAAERIHAGLIESLQNEVANLTYELDAVKRAASGVVVPIQTFDPEPYEVLKTIQIVVQPSDDEFMASFFDANVTAMGDNEGEAVENLKGLILDLFDSLMSKSPSKLGPAPKRQLAALQGFIRKRE